jgi:hypothetical protein
VRKIAGHEEQDGFGIIADIEVRGGACPDAANVAEGNDGKRTDRFVNDVLGPDIEIAGIAGCR